MKINGVQFIPVNSGLIDGVLTTDRVIIVFSGWVAVHLIGFPFCVGRAFKVLKRTFPPFFFFFFCVQATYFVNQVVLHALLYIPAERERERKCNAGE